MAELNTTEKGNLIESLFKGMDSVLSSKTVVGEPTKLGDTIIIPLIDVSFGVGAGTGNKGGACGGLSGKMSPSAVLIVTKGGHTKLVNVKNQDAVTKVLDMVPDLFDKISGFFNKEKMPADQDAINAAFPEE